MVEWWVQIGSLCLALAGAEMLHGIARAKWLVPRIGKERALKLSALTGTLLAFLVCWFFVPALGLRSAAAHGLLGLGLAVFMASFDVAVARFAMRRPWSKIWPDFNPCSGNYLLFGLLALTLIPLAIWWLRG